MGDLLRPAAGLSPNAAQPVLGPAACMTREPADAIDGFLPAGIATFGIGEEGGQRARHAGHQQPPTTTPPAGPHTDLVFGFHGTSCWSQSRKNVTFNIVEGRRVIQDSGSTRPAGALRTAGRSWR